MVPYRVELREKNILLDSITNSFRLIPIPHIEATSRAVRVWSGTELTYTLPLLESGMDTRSSLVQVTLSTSSVSELSNVIRSLVQYPYDGIEQTIASTLSNALALAFSDTIGLSIDR